MIPRFFLVSADDVVIDAFRSASRSSRFDFATSSTAAEGERILRSENYDTVFIDCDDLQGSKPLLTSLRKTATNKNSKIVAILNGDTTPPDALDLGASSTLQKPLTRQMLEREFKLASDALAKRQHQRVNVTMPVYISFGDTVDRLATALNISRGGMAVRCQSPIDADEMVRLKFQPLGMSTVIVARGEVAWADSHGLAGVRFTSIVGTGAEALQAWIDAITTRK